LWSCGALALRRVVLYIQQLYVLPCFYTYRVNTQYVMHAEEKNDINNKNPDSDTARRVAC
jgi:hypothetical protein